MSPARPTPAEIGRQCLTPYLQPSRLPRKAAYDDGRGEDMSLANMVRRMGEAGATIAEIADAIEAIENPPRERRLGGDAWRKIRLAVFERDGWRCRYCGKHTAGPHCDHIEPLARGGSNDLSNLATACPPCNLSKAAMSIAEWKTLQ